MSSPHEASETADIVAIQHHTPVREEHRVSKARRDASR
jgi:hypothetical protein